MLSPGVGRSRGRGIGIGVLAGLVAFAGRGLSRGTGTSARGLEFGGCHRGGGVGESQVQHVVYTTAVGQLRALGKPGCARGVEDAYVIVGMDLGRRKLIGRARHDHAVRPARGVVGQFTLAAHRNNVQRSFGSNRREHLQCPFEAFVIGDQHPGTRILEGVFEFGRSPPGVDADDGSADHHRRPIGDRPLRIVAHGDRHPVVGTDTVLMDQGVRQ